MKKFKDFIQTLTEEVAAPAATLNNTLGMGNVTPSEVFIPYQVINKKRRKKKKKNGNANNNCSNNICVGNNFSNS